jgi:hypothetical protein
LELIESPTNIGSEEFGIYLQDFPETLIVVDAAGRERSMRIVSDVLLS